MPKPKHITKSKMGATVLFCGHDGTFAADIYVHGNAALIVGPENTADKLVRPATGYDYHITDHPRAVYWSGRRGVFMVPVEQVIAHA